MSTKDNRLDFHSVLENLYGGTNPHVYFQPPENIQMQYPAIVYNRSNIKNSNGSNIVYLQEVTYQVIVIDKNPDSTIVDRISKYPTARFSRHYVANNLNHDVFMITYEKFL